MGQLMKNKGIYITLIILTMLLLTLPAIQQQWGLFRFKPLKGVSLATQRPKLSVKSFMDGSYQTTENQYLKEYVGFREPLIRCYNQMAWSLFHETYCEDVVVGKDKWLYGNHVVRDHFRQMPYQYADNNEELVKKFERNINRIKKVQQILDQRGTKLFVLICPSKDMVCPEHLPESRDYVMSDGLRAIEYMPKAFSENGINFLDLNAWFLSIKDTVDYPLFPMTGTHWSNVACMHAADTLIRYIEHLTGKNMPNVSIGPTYPSETRKPDNDLEEIMNLVWPIKPNQNYYAKVNVVPDSTAQRLRLITIGDSFFWNIAYTMPMDSLFESYPYWYYYNTVYYDPPHSNVKQLNMVDEINKADAVMILLTTNHLYDIFGAFFHRVINTFNPSKEVMEDILADIIGQIENDSLWLQKVEQRAMERGKTLEETKRAVALYVYKSSPDKYLSRFEAKTLKNAHETGKE